MRSYINICMATVFVVVGCAVGCVSTGLPNFGGDDFSRASIATVITRDKYDVTAKDGKVTWWVDAENKGTLRQYWTGIITAQTNPPGMIEIEFGVTVNGNSKQRIGQTDIIPKGDLPKDFAVIPDKIHCMLVPGAGCETPNTRVPSNWPNTPLTATVSAQCGTEKVMVREIPAPGLDVSIDGIEIDEEGGKKFSWSVKAKNNEDKMISLVIRTVFVTNNGEERTTDTEFVLKAQEERTIEGAPIRMKNKFKSVQATSKPISKKYLK